MPYAHSGALPREHASRQPAAASHRHEGDGSHRCGDDPGRRRRAREDSRGGWHARRDRDGDGDGGRARLGGGGEVADRPDGRRRDDRPCDGRGGERRRRGARSRSRERDSAGGREDDRRRGRDERRGSRRRGGDDGGILARPSATSLEYEGPSSSSAVSIHNIIERQSWESRKGISDDFDPTRRGYSICRDKRDEQQQQQQRNHHLEADSGGGFQRHQGRYNQQHRDAECDPRRSYDRHERPQDGRCDEDKHRGHRRCYQDHDNNRTYRRENSCDERRGQSRSRSRSRSRSSSTQSDGRKRGFRNDGRSKSDYHRLDDWSRASRDKVKDRDCGDRRRDYNDRRSEGRRPRSRSEDDYRGGRRAPSSGRSGPDGGGGGGGYSSLGARSGGPGARQAAAEKEEVEEGRPPPRIAYASPPASAPPAFRKFLLLLVGMPGSGKSTFARALEAGKPWKFARVNQDELGSRRRCEDACRRVLAEGRCPVVDRCNFDPDQRQPFLDVAREAGDVPVDCVVFTYPVEVCIRRCRGRGDSHETIRPGEEREVVSRMVQRFFPPLPNRINSETFRQLRNVTELHASNDAVLEYLSDPN